MKNKTEKIAIGATTVVVFVWLLIGLLGLSSCSTYRPEVTIRNFGTFADSRGYADNCAAKQLRDLGFYPTIRAAQDAQGTGWELKNEQIYIFGGVGSTQVIDAL